MTVSIPPILRYQRNVCIHFHQHLRREVDVHESPEDSLHEVIPNARHPSEPMVMMNQAAKGSGVIATNHLF